MDSSWIYHEDVDDVHEHGQDWKVCRACGAQWSSDDKRVAEGDGSCRAPREVSRHDQGEV